MLTPLTPLTPLTLQVLAAGGRVLEPSLGLTGGPVGPVSVRMRPALGADGAGPCLLRSIEFRLESLDIACGLSCASVSVPERVPRLLLVSDRFLGVAACVGLVSPGALCPPAAG